MKHTTSDTEEALGKAAELIKKSDWISAFTGAGMSVESGIPPFRGENGIWNTYDPKTLDLPHFNAHPEKCWITIKEIFYDFFGKAQPNAGHITLAEMEKAGRLKALITQNIDDLHSRAGSKNVIEFHGNSRRLLCRTCGKKYEAAGMDLSRLPPLCPQCGSVLKPDFVFFEEPIPFNALSEARFAAGRTDCMLVIGTTGEVYPAAALPQQAARSFAHIIEINPTPSAYTDCITTVYLPLPAGEALPRLWELSRA
ncbi:MAG: NAD-dependent protein deacylase [Spirochaetales bacterium]|jgi:NAD-dependent deacetylase|nr:NAD-dependent protein deacylase [Spirochaetales bacterium]